MFSKAVIELEEKLLKLNNISYKNIDLLMKRIMKSYKITAKELHNAFKQKHKKTPDDWIQEKMKKLQEDHKEIASGKKVDDEGYMARNELDTIEKAIQNLRKSIKSGKQQLPAWVQSKITKAADYIDTAAEYLESDEAVDESVGLYKKTDKNPISGGRTPKGSATQLTRSTGPGALTPSASAQLGPRAQELQKNKAKQVDIPSFVKMQKEEISLVEKILGEEKCGKGMYWCNTDKVCKPLPEGMKVSGQKIKPTEVGIGKAVDESCAHTKKGKTCPVHGMSECPMKEEKDPKGPVKSYKSPQELAKKHGVSLEQIKKQLEMGTKVEFEHTTSKEEARITALQHLDELPDYYSKLKKIEAQKESAIIRDCNGNPYLEFINLINSGTIEEENPCWKKYKKIGTKIKGGEEVNDCVLVKKESVDEAVRIPAQTGNNIFATLSWRGKYYNIQLFFPQAKIPSRLDITDEIQKIYPNSRVVTYRVADFKQGEPIVYAYKGGNAGKLGPDKNYVKPMGESVEVTEEGDWWHPDPAKDRTLPGRGPALRAREDSSVRSKPKEDPKELKPGESYMQYAKRIKSMKEGVEILDEKK
jgi:hypothetical protein